MIVNHIASRKENDMEDLFDGLFENSAPIQDKKVEVDKSAMPEKRTGLPQEDERELTPLEKMKLAKENKTSGMIVENKEEEKMYKSPAEAGLEKNGTESMNEMDWADGDHIMTAINLLKEKFQDELEFDIVSFSNDPNLPIFSIDIQELGPLPNYTSVVWTHTTAWKQIWFGPR